MTALRTILAGALMGAASAAAIALQVRHATAWHPYAIAWGAFVLVAAFTVASARHRGGDRATGLTAGVVIAVLVGSALAQAPGLFANPQTSNEAYRALWDGRVQQAPADPYRYVPLDDRLAHLRDPLTFPGLGQQESSGVTTPARQGRLFAGATTASPADALTVVPRPQAGPVDPPGAVAVYAGVAWLTPVSLGTRGVQAACALVAVVTALLLAIGLGRRGHDPGYAVLYAGSPVVVLEGSSNGHVQVLGTAALVAAALWAHRRELAGLFAGLGGLLMVTPLLMLPAFGGRVSQVVRTWLTAVVVFGVGIAAHAVNVGWSAAGFLPQYVRDHGYLDGTAGYEVLRLVSSLQASVLPVIALLLAVGAALLALVRTRADATQTLPTLTWLYGAALLLTTPAGPWNSVPLAALAVGARRLEWMAVPIAAYATATYSGAEHHGIKPGWYYGGAVVLVLLASLVRAAHRRRSS